MTWKIVFSFSAEFLNGGGGHNTRKEEAEFCHTIVRKSGLAAV